MSKKIPLSQGQFAIIDDEDYEWLNQWNWCVQRRSTKNRTLFSVIRSVNLTKLPGKKKSKTIYMHRVIMNANNGEFVDHIDGNPLNNCKSNLRIVTIRENNQNRHHPRTSKYPGVFKREDRGGKWQAKIKVNGKYISLGTFNNELEAAKAYEWGCKQVELNKEINSLLKKTSSYKGVSWDKLTKKWKALGSLNGKTVHLGLFLDEKEAHEAYLGFNEKRKKVFYSESHENR